MFVRYTEIIAIESFELLKRKFRYVKATNEGVWAYFADYNSKIGCHGNAP